jgi:hypothetical protein
MVWRTWKMIEERMRNAIIVRAGASGRSRYNYVGAQSGTGSAQQRTPSASSGSSADADAAAERVRKIAEYNDRRDAYFARNCVE